MRRRKYREGNSLMQIAAAVVGTSAAIQVVGPAKRPEPHPLGCDCGCDADGFTDGSHGGSPREATDPRQVDQESADDQGRWPQTDVREGFWRIATDEGVTVDGVRDSTCDLHGYTPAIEQTVPVLGAMVREGLAESRDGRFYPSWDAVAPALPAEDVSEQADQHTYLTEQTPGTYEQPGRLDVVGANQRRLIALRAPEGVYVGGCLVASTEDLERLTAWLRGCNGGAFE